MKAEEDIFSAFTPALHRTQCGASVLPPLSLLHHQGGKLFYTVLDPGIDPKF
jgi:hypothetical protein